MSLPARTPSSERSAPNSDDWRIVVCGGRTWGQGPSGDKATENLRAALQDALDGAGEPHSGLTLIHGACPTGADHIADQWAKSHPEVQLERHPADWSRYGRRAGAIRNQQMVNSLDPKNPRHWVIAAWDGHSAGTKITVNMAFRRGIPVTRVPEGE